MDNLAATRRTICEACEHYSSRLEACTYLRKTGKGAGKLTHQNGVSNPRISCPLKKWLSLPSNHAHQLSLLLPEVDAATLHKISQYGLHQSVLLDFVYKYYRNGKMTRTVLFEKLLAITKTPNDYSHL